MLAKCNNPVFLWEEGIPLDTVILYDWRKPSPLESPRELKVQGKKGGRGHLKHLVFYYGSGGPPSLQPSLLLPRKVEPAVRPITAEFPP